MTDDTVARTDETEHETAARFLMAERSHRPASAWRVVRTPTPTEWFDFADPATGTVGQCCALSTGGWFQAPRGDAPVILAYAPRRRDA